MKNIKNFEQFLNEELKTDTYRKASDKLKSMGHKKRASKIDDYIDDKVKNITPVTVKINGDTYTLDHENIHLQGGEEGGNVDIMVIFDKDNYEKTEKQRWETLTKREKDEFMMTFNIKDESVFDKKYSELDVNTKEDFQEFMDMSHVDLFIEILHGYDGKNSIIWKDTEVSGVLIDRSSANKILKLLKEFGEAKGGRVEDAINSIRVNHLYQD